MIPPRARISWLIRHVPLLHRDWIQFFDQLIKEYGDIVYFRLPGVPLCMINDPSYIESVLTCDPNISLKSKNYRALARILGEGLIVSDGEFWRRQRRLAQPSFHRDLIGNQIKLMANAVEEMLKGWRTGQVVDVHDEMMRLTLAIASVAFLGTDMEAKSRVITSAMQTLMQQYAGLGMYLVPAWLPTRNNLRARVNVQRIDRVIAEIIRARETSVEKSTDLLSVLLSVKDEDGHGMTGRQLRDEVVTMFLAGHETTANALSWTWYLLARHPHVENRMIAELTQVLGDRIPDVADIAQLRYTNMVIKESMRLYPPVGGIGRETVSRLQIGRYDLPPGTNIFISQWLMHRNSRYFDDPDAFKPERWTEDFERKLPSFVYFPFGGGPRLCIGASFAMTEMIVLLAVIARRVRVRLTSEAEIKPVFSISLRPAGGVRVIVTAR